MNENGCMFHSGVEKSLLGLDKTNDAQWTKIRCLENRMNKIMGRLNVILGGIVVACILLLINILIRVPGVPIP